VGKAQLSSSDAGAAAPKLLLFLAVVLFSVSHPAKNIVNARIAKLGAFLIRSSYNMSVTPDNCGPYGRFSRAMRTYAPP
jgi:hypothetical protein